MTEQIERRGGPRPGSGRPSRRPATIHYGGIRVTERQQAFLATQPGSVAQMMRDLIDEAALDALIKARIAGDDDPAAREVVAEAMIAEGCVEPNIYGKTIAVWLMYTPLVWDTYEQLIKAWKAKSDEYTQTHD